MASIIAGTFGIDRALVDAGEFLEELFEVYGPLAIEQNITLARQGDVRGALVYADRSRLMQAFGNVVGNALKFCKRGDTVTLQFTREHDGCG